MRLWTLCTPNSLGRRQPFTARPDRAGHTRSCDHPAAPLARFMGDVDRGALRAVAVRVEKAVLLGVEGYAGALPSVVGGSRRRLLGCQQPARTRASQTGGPTGWGAVVPRGGNPVAFDEHGADFASSAVGARGDCLRDAQEVLVPSGPSRLSVGGHAAMVPNPPRPVTERWSRHCRHRDQYRRRNLLRGGVAGPLARDT